MKTRFISMILALCMIISMVCVGIVPAAADSTDTVETYAQETVRGSNILQCFDWSYNAIKANMADIAKAGYTAVQTSPVQPPKDYSASWTDTPNQWWKLYQPLDLKVSDGNTWLGTKAELTAMCTEAQKYGIKVIVDIVSNHLANDGSSSGLYEHLNSAVASDMKNPEYFFSTNNWTSDNSRYELTYYHQGMPELNTRHPYVQQKALDLLKECIDCGVDGFRFDTAKHIELPGESDSTHGAFGSDYWPTVVNGAKDYAQTKGLAEPFFYGEILNTAGTAISNYTQYIAVTDNKTGDRALDKAYWSAASELADSSYLMGAGASDSVLWVESHDTYMGESGSAYFKNTKNVASEFLNKAWAIVGARAESTGLFFARPNSTMGLASSDTNWKSPEVAEVNKFKNHFVGTSETLSSSGNTAFIVRGNKGVVISKLDGAGSVNLSVQMKSGTYTDQVTGNPFTVANGKISGTVGSTGVAVVYNADDTAFNYITAPTLYLRPSPAWIQSGGRYAMYFFNSSTGDTQWVSMTSVGDNYYSGSVPAGNWTNVIFCRMDGSNGTNDWDNKKDQTGDLSPDTGTNLYNVASGKWSVYGSVDPTDSPATQPSEEPTVQPTEQPTEAGDTYTVYAANKNGWDNMNVYYWGSSKSTVDWPGTAMTQGSAVFKAEIPNDVTGVIFNNGSSQTVNIESGIKNNAEWVITADKDGNNYKVETGPTYYLVGDMNGWKNTDGYAFTLNTAETNAVEYKLSGVQLSANAEMKVHDSKDTWYPSGGNNNYKLSSTGTYDVYFRPNANGGIGWHNGYFKLIDVTSYTVTWKNYDGTILATDTVVSGVTPTYKGETPVKESTEQSDYTFSGWDPSPIPISADTIYTAQFTESPKTFTVTWKNDDGTVLETDTNVAYGSKPVYNGSTPTKANDGETSYAFQGWSPQITDNTKITEDTTYTARFLTNVNTYTITWKDGDGNILKTEQCPEGIRPQYTGDTPTKTADAQYTYSFNYSWTPGIAAADADATYTANFDKTLNKYTVQFKNYNGDVLQRSEVEYGTVPAYTGETPTKPASLTKSYTFSGWNTTPVAVTGETIYTAQFTEANVDTISISAINFIGWDDVYVYYWLGDDNNSWPGTEMTADANGLVYTASIPATAEGIIFSDGNGNQTANITEGIAAGARWAISKGENNAVKVNAAPDYYLVGTMTDPKWSTDNASVFNPVKNDNGLEEYKASTVALSKDDAFKAYDSKDDIWYPDGVDTNYIVTADGTYDIYFRPNSDGNEDWHEDVLYAANVTTYTVTWADGDGNTLKTDTVTYGTTPAYTGETPTKTATAQYTYTFNNTWSPAIAPVTADATYTAQFTETVNKYTVTWKNEDGTVIDTTTVAYGEVPTHADPTKAADALYTYTFAGWTPQITAVTGDAIYTANYTSELKDNIVRHSLTLKEANIGLNFYIPVGATLGTVTYKGTVTDALIKGIKLIDNFEYQQVQVFVPAAEMTEEIAVTYSIDGVAYTDTYTVAQYANTIISGNYDEDLQSLVKSMLNYGAEAQTEFERNTDHLADEGIDYAPAAVVPDTINAAIPDKAEINATLAGGNLTYYGFSLLLKSDTALRFYFKKSSNDVALSDLSVMIDDNAAEIKAYNDRYVYVDIVNIRADDLDTAYALTVNGSDIGSYSVLSYVKDTLKNHSDEEQSCNTVSALYDFHLNAETYFANHH